MIKRLLAAVAASVAVVGASAGAALAEYPPTSSGGTVSATLVAPGDHVDFAGDGFASGSKVTVSVNHALYSTVVAGGAAEGVEGDRIGTHFVTSAYVRPAAAVAATASASFSARITLSRLGKNVLLGTGVDPAGRPRAVDATVMVEADTVTAAKGSDLPFTGSAVIIPGAIVGLTMLGGGFLMLTTVRSRKAGARS